MFEKYNNSMNINKQLKRNNYILTIIVIILLLSYFFLKIFTIRSEKVLLDYSKNQCVNIITSIINNSINNMLDEYDSDELIIVLDNDSNNINFNNKKINTILYNSTQTISKSIMDLEKENSLYFIPIGLMYDIPVLTDIGPQIPFKIKTIGNVIPEIYNNVISYGINNTLIQVLLKIVVEVQVILPFRSQIVKVEKNILLDSKIIQGKIPKYYGGLINNS